MTAFEDLHPLVVALVGDVHANAQRMRAAIRYAKTHGAQAVIQLGDFAYDMRENFDGSPNFLDEVAEAAADYDMPVAWIDGNHDNHVALQALVAEHGHVPIPIRPNVYYLPRGYRWTWTGVSFLALGGAHSVDRPWRTPHVEWWPGETIGAGDALRACEGGRADVMLCHDVPAGVRIPSIEGNPYGFQARELEAAERNRRVLREVVSVVRPKRLFAGHYHCRLSAELVARNHRTQVDILDADFAPIGDNVVVVDLAALR
ncbi:MULTISPECIES: metallophosphoesterase family protein [Nocardia]|uniref:metallophosphoesterase family protein n=1 Tax=Nocardia TaxID=1817 RepID=UPI0013004280|nr:MULTISPECIES: metallophosphoesterase family protein [Nocardia]